MGDNNASILCTDKPPHINGLSVIVNPGNPTLDIVFVHGFTGHPERTWVHKGEASQDSNDERPSKFAKILSGSSTQGKRSAVRKDVYWPRDLVPVTVPNARIITFGYDTRIRHRFVAAADKTSTVYDIAWDFLVGLEAARRSDPSRPLLFIAHSLGGIIVKETLRRSRGCDVFHNQKHLRDVYLSTAGVFFFGTPHGGADPRSLLHHIAEKCIKAAGFSVSEQIVNTLLPSSERLKELRDEFGPMARDRNWVIYSFQEGHGVRALNNEKVVEDTSSCLNDHSLEITQRIARNHMDMCRFSGVDDAEYGKVVGALNRIVLRSQPAIVPPTVSTVPRVDSKPGLSAELMKQRRRDYLNSLQFSQIDARHATIRTAHDQTCRWFLENRAYVDWRDIEKLQEHHGFMWIKGKPGTGKSTIMKFILSETKKTMELHNPTTVITSFFFNARGEYLEKSAIGMYRSLVFQFLSKVTSAQPLFDYFQPAYSDTVGSRTFYKWEIETLKDLLRNAIESLQNRDFVCFVDALDECDEDQVREMVAFFESLGKRSVSRFEQSGSRVFICFSSRHYPYIALEKGVELVLEHQIGHDQDIANYLSTELRAGQGRSERTQRIKSEIYRKSSGIFLWVVIVVHLLNKEFAHGRVHGLLQRLDEIPNDLDDLFETIITKDYQNMEELLLCLQWILYARRPLQSQELYFAILAGLEPTALSEWDPNGNEVTREDMDRFILSCSKGLAEVTKSGDPRVQFIHESVPEYLRKENRLGKLLSRPDLGNNFPGLSHERLRQCCQNYCSVIGTPQFVLRCTPRLTESTAPFMPYAARNLFYHANEAEGFGLSQDNFVRSVAAGSWEDWVRLYNLYDRYSPPKDRATISLLYFLIENSWQNLVLSFLKRLLNTRVAGEPHDFPFRTPYAHEDLAHLDELDDTIKALLLPSAVSPPKARGLVQPPPHQEEIRTVLQRAGDLKARRGVGILLWSAQNGHASLLKLLLAMRDPDINSVKEGRKPLSWAAERGHEVTVKLLLSAGVDPDCNGGRSRQTPLSYASENGHEGIVKLLLSIQGVDPDSKSINNYTPLCFAAGNGHLAVVKLLSANPGVNANVRTSHFLLGRSLLTPLSLAATNGHITVVKHLLGLPAVDPDPRTKAGDTLLTLSTYGGQLVVFLHILSLKQVSPHVKGERGCSALWYAAKGGHEAIVEALLGVPHIDPESKNDEGQSALSVAAKHGHEAVVRLLLTVEGVDPDSRDSGEGRTPLEWAKWNGRSEAVVKLLEQRQKKKRVDTTKD